MPNTNPLVWDSNRKALLSELKTAQRELERLPDATGDTNRKARKYLKADFFAKLSGKFSSLGFSVSRHDTPLFSLSAYRDCLPPTDAQIDELRTSIEADGGDLDWLKELQSELTLERVVNPPESELQAMGKCGLLFRFYHADGHTSCGDLSYDEYKFSEEDGNRWRKYRDAFLGAIMSWRDVIETCDTAESVRVAFNLPETDATESTQFPLIPCEVGRAPRKHPVDFSTARNIARLKFREHTRYVDNCGNVGTPDTWKEITKDLCELLAPLGFGTTIQGDPVFSFAQDLESSPEHNGVDCRYHLVWYPSNATGPAWKSRCLLDAVLDPSIVKPIKKISTTQDLTDALHPRQNGVRWGNSQVFKKSLSTALHGWCNSLDTLDTPSSFELAFSDHPCWRGVPEAVITTTASAAPTAHQSNATATPSQGIKRRRRSEPDQISNVADLIGVKAWHEVEMIINGDAEIACKRLGSKSEPEPLGWVEKNVTYQLLGQLILSKEKDGYSYEEKYKTQGQHVAKLNDRLTATFGIKERAIYVRKRKVNHYFGEMTTVLDLNTHLELRSARYHDTFIEESEIGRIKDAQYEAMDLNLAEEDEGYA